MMEGTLHRGTVAGHQLAAPGCLPVDPAGAPHEGGAQGQGDRRAALAGRQQEAGGDHPRLPVHAGPVARGGEPRHGRGSCSGSGSRERRRSREQQRCAFGAAVGQGGRHCAVAHPGAHGQQVRDKESRAQVAGALMFSLADCCMTMWLDRRHDSEPVSQILSLPARCSLARCAATQHNRGTQQHTHQQAPAPAVNSARSGGFGSPLPPPDRSRADSTSAEALPDAGTTPVGAEGQQTPEAPGVRRLRSLQTRLARSSMAHDMSAWLPQPVEPPAVSLLHACCRARCSAHVPPRQLQRPQHRPGS